MKFHLLAIALAVSATPLQKRSVSVTIANGTINGGSSGNVEYFKGIPFAQPPVGKLRFQHPQPYDESFGELDGTKTAPLCMQSGDNVSEDCLKLLVIRPANRPSEKLPVTVFIHGGAFGAGGAEEGNDGTPLVSRAVDQGKPFVFVSIQYRLGPFGFLPGKEMAGNSNLGLRDQRLALQWVQDNIAAFGGDPGHVVLYGFSAGSMSAMDHTIIHGGDAQGLFHGALLASGSMLPALNVDSPKAQEVYDTVASRVGCGSSENTLECLRELDAEKLSEVGYSLSTEYNHLGINLAFLPRPDPSDNFFASSPDAALTSGKFAKVPVMSGDTEDEGTLFALTQSNLTNNAQLVNYLRTYYPGNEEFTTSLVAKYPDDLGISGAPYGTGLGSNVFGQYKRLASILGDMAFIFQRRFHLQTVCSEVPCHSYLNSALQGLGVLGSFHGSDGMVMLSGASTIPARTQQDYAIAFINTLDPNGLGTQSPLIQWPRYTATEAKLVHQKALGNKLTTDDFRATQYKYWSENVAKFRI